LASVKASPPTVRPPNNHQFPLFLLINLWHSFFSLYIPRVWRRFFSWGSRTLRQPDPCNRLLPPSISSLFPAAFRPLFFMTIFLIENFEGFEEVQKTPFLTLFDLAFVILLQRDAFSRVAVTQTPTLFIQDRPFSISRWRVRDFPIFSTSLVPQGQLPQLFFPHGTGLLRTFGGRQNTSLSHTGALSSLLGRHLPCFMLVSEGNA